MIKKQTIQYLSLIALGTMSSMLCVHATGDGHIFTNIRESHGWEADFSSTTTKPIVFEITGFNFDFNRPVKYPALAKALNNSIETNHVTIKKSKNGPTVKINIGFMKILMDYIDSNQKITYLNFENCKIDAQAFQFFTQKLKTNTTLKNLRVNKCEINDNNTKDLAEALKVNQTLTTLEAVENQIGDTGASYLAEALQSNSTLNNLYIKENPSITDKSIQIFKQVLKINNNPFLSIGLLEGYLQHDGANPARLKSFNRALEQQATAQVGHRITPEAPFGDIGVFFQNSSEDEE